MRVREHPSYRTFVLDYFSSFMPPILPFRDEPTLRKATLPAGLRVRRPRSPALLDRRGFAARKAGARGQHAGLHCRRTMFERWGRADPTAVASPVGIPRQA